METLIVTPKNKQAIPFLKHLLANLTDVKSVEVVDIPDNPIAKSISAGLQDVKEIIAGKKKGKHLKELLDED